jgi:ABC-type multidrug transport system ATPase subunit
VNGAGKSTLLGAITGTVRMDSGQALVHSKVRVGYLKQSAVSGSTKTVYEEAKSEMTLIEEARERLERISKKVENGDFSDEALEEMGEAQEEFQNVGGYEQEHMVESVLKGLGFTPDDSDRLCSDFSGGWQMRIALARYVDFCGVLYRHIRCYCCLLLFPLIILGCFFLSPHSFFLTNRLIIWTLLRETGWVNILVNMMEALFW